MGWSIAVTVNAVKISSACAKELFEAQEEGDIWYDLEDVIHKGVLSFNSDHMEHMDWLGSNDTMVDILKSHKVKGDICFGSLEGDNEGSFWGYRFDGSGGMAHLTGRLVYEVQTFPLEGMTFVVTGTFADFTRDSIESKIRELGGEVATSLSKKVTHLLVGDKPGSKLEKAKKMGIAVMSEKDFLALAK